MLLAAPDESVGDTPGAARKANLLLARPGFLQIARPFAAGREKIDLKDEHVVLRRLDDIFERGVRHEPAVPIPDAIDLDRRQAGRQRARGEDVARVEAPALRVEIAEISGLDPDPPARQPPPDRN